MLAMARALAPNPALLLLDELSMGLAPLIVEELYEIVAQVAHEGVSILVVEQFARAVLPSPTGRRSCCTVASRRWGARPSSKTNCPPPT